MFQVLLALTDGKRHGWSLVREVQQRGGFSRIMPGNFYRTLRTMLAEGLIAEVGITGRSTRRRRAAQVLELTRLGEAVAGAEAARLEAAVVEARAKRLLARSRG